MPTVFQTAWPVSQFFRLITPVTGLWKYAADKVILLKAICFDKHSFSRSCSRDQNKWLASLCAIVIRGISLGSFAYSPECQSFLCSSSSLVVYFDWLACEYNSPVCILGSQSASCVHPGVPCSLHPVCMLMRNSWCNDVNKQCNACTYIATRGIVCLCIPNTSLLNLQYTSIWYIPCGRQSAHTYSQLRVDVLVRIHQCCHAGWTAQLPAGYPCFFYAKSLITKISICITIRFRGNANDLRSSSRPSQVLFPPCSLTSPMKVT